MTYTRFLTILHLYIEQYGTQPVKLRINTYNMIQLLDSVGIPMFSIDGTKNYNIEDVRMFHGLDVIYDDNIIGDHLVLEGPGAYIYQVPASFSIEQTEPISPQSTVSWVESVWFYC